MLGEDKYDRIVVVICDMAEKVFIIEDDKFLIKILSRKLEEEGFTVFQASEGNEALRRVIEEKPDIILLDLILPGKNGFEILTEVMRHEDMQKTPVIILSNLGQIADIERGLALGAKDYIIKTDLNLNDISEKIKEQIVKSKMKNA